MKRPGHVDAPVSDRNEALAAEFERIARALREGEATVYGHRVQFSPASERGGIAYDDRWLRFELEESGTPGARK